MKLLTYLAHEVDLIGLDPSRLPSWIVTKHVNFIMIFLVSVLFLHTIPIPDV